MVLKKGFSCFEWRRALEDAENILQFQEEEECGWDVFTQEILPRLPANQLQTLKIVSKNWNRIISSPYFISFHLNIYNNRSQFRVLMLKTFGWKTYDGSIRVKSRVREYNINCDCEEESKRIRIRCPPDIAERPLYLLGSCDGLLCLYSEGSRRTIVTYNPSTAKSLWQKSYRKDNYYITCSWFGRHPCSGEYVLVLGDLYTEVGVYKFNRRSNLQKIHSTSRCINPQFGICSCHRVGTLLHGAVHWPVQCLWNRQGYVISSYHLQDNKYSEISPPLQSDFKLGVAEGCLFAIFMSDTAPELGSHAFEMWIMKEYGVQQSWIKYVNFEGLNCFSMSPLRFFPNGNDLILYPNESGLIKYTFNDNKALLLMNDDYDNETIICADSLVSPKIVGT